MSSRDNFSKNLGGKGGIIKSCGDGTPPVICATV